MDNRYSYPSHSGVAADPGSWAPEKEGRRKGRKEGGREGRRNRDVWQTLPNAWAQPGPARCGCRTHWTRGHPRDAGPAVTALSQTRRQRRGALQAVAAPTAVPLAQSGGMMSPPGRQRPEGPGMFCPRTFCRCPSSSSSSTGMGPPDLGAPA